MMENQGLARGHIEYMYYTRYAIIYYYTFVIVIKNILVNFNIKNFFLKISDF